MIITLVERILFSKKIIDIVNAISKEVKIKPFYNFLSTHYLFEITDLKDFLGVIDTLDKFNIKAKISKLDAKECYILNLYED